MSPYKILGKALVEGMNGRIWVDSQGLGKGTTSFAFTVPLSRL